MGVTVCKHSQLLQQQSKMPTLKLSWELHLNYKTIMPSEVKEHYFI